MFKLFSCFFKKKEANSNKLNSLQLKLSLGKTSNSFNQKIKGLFSDNKLSKDILSELEDILISSDIGVNTTEQIIEHLKAQKFDKTVSIGSIKQSLIASMTEILSPYAQILKIKKQEAGPFVIMISGVNGVGKTTTIAKLANYYKNQGHKITVAACDTFRAAAVEQLEIWTKKIGVNLVKSAKEKADPASVAYQALEQSLKDKTDVLIIDTAGRLNNKTDLMDELKKIIRVMQKLDKNIPHSSLLVLDATVGQNAHNQMASFQTNIDINGLIITKLDGTAKGGAVFSLAEKFKTPIFFIGLGETINDLQPFVASDFVKCLFN